MVDRAAPKKREEETREVETRAQSWAPPKMLPDPIPEPGWKNRWIRTSILGQSDNRNVSARFREGYVPVLAKDQPELQLKSDRNSEFPENVEVGGLLLCKIPEEMVQERNEYYADKNSAQIESVDNQFLRHNDPRMPLSKPERRTRTTFGSGGEK